MSLSVFVTVLLLELHSIYSNVPWGSTPVLPPILSHISRYKIVTINLSGFSLNAHDEPIGVS